MTNYLQAAGFTWAANGDATVAIQYEGNVYLAKVPASSVRFELRKAARLEGMNLEALGDVDILGWFGGKIWRSAKKAARSVVKHVVPKKIRNLAKRVAKRALKTVKADALWRIAKRYGGKAAKWGLKAVQSKEFGALIAASALVCPAIGGPALAAYAVANRAAWALKAGHSSAKTITNNVRRIARGKRPTLNQRYLLSAFRSIAA